jgi:uncharacterized protein
MDGDGLGGSGRGVGQPRRVHGADGWLPVSTRAFHAIVEGYALHPMGIHGLPHWGRVMENGRRLAEAAGADPLVVDLFALFHDARRRNEHHDPGHGARGAELAWELRDLLPPLTDLQLDLLSEACAHHTDGRVHPHPTIGACWDADRLDLWRVGIPPDEDMLSTAAARDPAILDWAQDRSSEFVVPSFVTEEWMEGGRRDP